MSIPSRGVIVPLVTPFSQDEDVDVSGFRSNVEFFVRQPVDGLLVLATTGEAASISIDEKRQLIDTTVEVANGTLPVLVGVGGTNVRETEKLIDHAESVEAAGLFVISPYFYKVTPDEYLRYYQRLADATSLPLMLYNSTYANMPLTPAVMEKLVEIPTVVALKEGNQLQLGEMARLFGGRLSIFTARDLYILETLMAGGHGSISFACNVVPELVVALYRACSSGDLALSRELQWRLNPLVNRLVARSYPSPIKAAMDEVGLTGGYVRRPLTTLSAVEREELRRVLAELGDYVPTGKAL